MSLWSIYKGVINIDKAAPLTLEQKELIISMYDKYTCVEISNITGISINQIYGLRQKLGITNKNFITYNLTDTQEQIFLGGKLGDGNFKPNGKHSYYYRETHAEGEIEYLIWKSKELGDIVNIGCIHKLPMRAYNVQQPYEFATKTTTTLVKYAEMSLDECISLLNYKGLIIFLLDDGWYSNHSNVGNYCISGGVLTEENKWQVCKKFEEFGVLDCHVTGIKSRDITIPSKNNKILFDLATSFIPKDIDVIKKKFRKQLELDKINKVA